MDAFEKWHLLTGRALIRIGNDGADLENDRALWSQLWDEFCPALLPESIERHQGRRPPAFYEFDTAAFPAHSENETEVSYLYRLGVIGEDEISGIKAKAISLINHNRGRDPADVRSNFIPDTSGFIEFCLNHGLLTGDE